MLAVVGIPSREARPPGSGEDTLSPELRTAGLLRPHVWVGYQWSHTGFCPGGNQSEQVHPQLRVTTLPEPDPTLADVSLRCNPGTSSPGPLPRRLPRTGSDRLEGEGF